MNIKDLNKKVEDRFWKKVGISEDADECWKWNASKTGDGYSQLRINNKTEYGHRISWLLHNCREYDEIPKGLYVLHSCDNRTCTNPNHLRIGTQKDNMEDKSVRGDFVGDNNHRTKISDEQVLKLFLSSEKPKVLAKKYKIGLGNIYAIRRGEIRQSVTEGYKKG